MSDDNQFPTDSGTAASSMLHCLRMLEEEAENMRLLRTRLALQKAIRACRAEQTVRAMPRTRRGRILH